MPITLKQAKAIIVFYKHYSGFPVLISLLCCFFYLESGNIAALTKLATDTFILYIVFWFNNEKLYYYYNLHISRMTIAISFIITDLVLFSISLWITSLFI